ncbi:MAG: PA-phosphatase [Bdellovibrionales bacterium RIFOXYD1_FULL_53_11]|nr:MAG: PA-phosphatase [Bdellovibrionales bacterium RIFOXYD1_FULL_53_11]
MKNSQPTHWCRQIAAVIFQHGVLKAVGVPLFIGLFFGAYFYVLKTPAYPTTVMPFTWLDRMISFQPWAMSLYVSLWVYVSLPPALIATRRELYRYGRAMAGTCLAGLIVFYFWPTAVPVADIDWARYPGVDFLKNVDAAGNAFPSLHVATALFSGVWLDHLLRRFGAPPWSRLFSWMWCIGIIYSTLATRQHVAVDVWGGLVLGAAAAWLSLRQRARAERMPGRI